MQQSASSVKNHQAVWQVSRTGGCLYVFLPKRWSEWVNKACIQSIVCVVYAEIPNRNVGVCGLLSIVCRLFTRNFFLCLHVDLISILLLSKQFLFSSFKIQNFSSKHKLHRFGPPVYEIARFKICQLILKSFLLSFNAQIYFESSVLFECPLCSKVYLRLAERSSKCSCSHTNIIHDHARVAYCDCCFVYYNLCQKLWDNCCNFI
jgi:hypothetical protein